jgi:hypothetical protein
MEITQREKRRGGYAVQGGYQTAGNGGGPSSYNQMAQSSKAAGEVKSMALGNFRFFGSNSHPWESNITIILNKKYVFLLKRMDLI